MKVANVAPKKLFIVTLKTCITQSVSSPFRVLVMSTVSNQN